MLKNEHVKSYSYSNIVFYLKQYFGFFLIGLNQTQPARIKTQSKIDPNPNQLRVNPTRHEKN